MENETLNSRIPIPDEILPCLVLLRSRDDESTRKWIPENDFDVPEAEFFIDDPLPHNYFRYLSIEGLPSAFNIKSITVGFCGVTQSEVDEWVEGTPIFPNLARILTHADPDATGFTTEITAAKWLLRPEYTGGYAALLKAQFEKIDNIARLTKPVKEIHKLDAVLTALCGGRRNDSLWLGCLTCEEHVLLLFRARLLHQDEAYTPPRLSLQVELIGTVRCARRVARHLLASADFSAHVSQAADLLENTNQARGNCLCTQISWQKLLSKSVTTDLDKLLEDLQMRVSRISKSAIPASSAPTPLHLPLTVKGDCTMSNAELAELSDLIQQFRHTTKVPITDFRLITLSAGYDIAQFSPGSNDISHITSASSLLSILRKAQIALCPATSLRRIPLIALLKLVTLRMTRCDRWQLFFFGHTVIKNGTKKALRLKRDNNSLSQLTFTYERQDIWARLSNMESFGIAARGLASAVDALLPPDIATSTDVACLFFEIARLYEEFDGHTCIASLVEAFIEAISDFFVKMRAHILDNKQAKPPRLGTYTEELSERLKNIRETSRQQTSIRIIADEGYGRTGSKSRDDNGLNLNGKAVAIGKTLMSLNTPRNRGSSSSTPRSVSRSPTRGSKRRRTGRSPSPSPQFGSKPLPCNICDHRSHRYSQC